MGQELQLPDAFKNAPVPKAFAGLNPQDDNLSDGIGQSYGVIGYKGKQWSIRHRGVRHDVNDPKTGYPLPYLDVIILGQAKVKAKSYYPKGYVEGSTERPICASIDGLTPDADVQQKQANHCAICPHNEFKTDENGRKGKECSDYKRVAVLVLPTQTTPIFGAPLMEPLFLRVPPASLNGLAIMGETMAAQGRHYATYITRISFDPNKAFPVMLFKPIQPLTEAEGDVVMGLRNDPLIGRITGADVVVARPPMVALQAPGSVASGLTAPAQAGTEDVTVIPASQEMETTTSVSKASAPPAIPDGPPNTVDTPSMDTPSLASGLANTGIGGVQPATQAEPIQLPANQDAGEPQETDSDLDARIAAMIKH